MSTYMSIAYFCSQNNSEDTSGLHLDLDVDDVVAHVLDTGDVDRLGVDIVELDIEFLDSDDDDEVEVEVRWRS